MCCGGKGSSLYLKPVKLFTKALGSLWSLSAVIEILYFVIFY